MSESESVGMTGRGIGVAATAAGFLATGLALHYPAFVAVGVWCAVALLFAAAAIARPVRMTAYLTGVPARVVRDGSVRITVRVTNLGRRRSSPCLAMLRGAGLGTSVPSLRPGGTHAADLRPALRRRGEQRLGPVDLVRTDPLRLLRRRHVSDADATILVIPAVTVLPALRAASRYDGSLPGAFFEGSVEFHSLRAYVSGDDPRRVHWPSYQRTGDLLVRTFVDVTRPSCTVFLDSHPASYDGVPAAVEEAVDTAASIAMASAEDGQLILLAAGEPAARVDGAAALDSLARWTPGGAGLTSAGVGAGAGGGLVVVTGPADNGLAAAVRQLAGGFGWTLLVRVGVPAEQEGILRTGPVRTLAVGAELSRSWARLRDAG